MLGFSIRTLHPPEQKHFVIRLRNKHCVFKAQAQGAALSPLGWGRLAALASRSTQSMFSPNEALLWTFVDNLGLTLTNTKAYNKAIVPQLSQYGDAGVFPLALRKGTTESKHHMYLSNS
jgi:hypothetical protein